MGVKHLIPFISFKLLTTKSLLSLKASEKGVNKYTRVDESKCNNAINWWDENNVKWSFVVDKWNTIYSKKDDISLRRSVEDKPLFPCHNNLSLLLLNFACQVANFPSKVSYTPSQPSSLGGRPNFFLIATGVASCGYTFFI